MNIFVRVLGARQLEHAHIQPDLVQKAHRLVCRLLPRLVAVVVDDHLFGIAGKHARMLRRDGGTERGNRIFKPRRLNGDGVHIPLAENQALRAGVFGKIQPEKHAAFLKPGCVGGVEVFRLAVIHYPPAERHDIARGVNYRKHHPIAEKVKQPPRFLRAPAEKPRGQLLLRVAFFLHIAGQRAEIIRRKAQPEMPDDRQRQPAFFGKVRHALPAHIRVKQAGTEKFCRVQVHFIHAPAGKCLALPPAAVLRNGNPHPRGKKLQRADIV